MWLYKLVQNKNLSKPSFHCKNRQKAAAGTRYIFQGGFPDCEDTCTDESAYIRSQTTSVFKHEIFTSENRFWPDFIQLLERFVLT